MKKITQDIIKEKKQHLHILKALKQHSPLGLTLHDLTYLLTNKNNMYKMSSLQERFGKSRNDVFKTRQRIHDCLTDLKRINLIQKTREKYRLNLFEFYFLIQRERLNNQLKEYEQEERANFEKIRNDMKYLSERELEEIETELWEEQGKKILNEYLTGK